MTADQRRTREIEQREEQEALFGADQARDECGGQATDQIARNDAGHIGRKGVRGAYLAPFRKMRQASA